MNVKFLHDNPAALQQCRQHLEQLGISGRVYSSAVTGIFALAFKGPSVAAVVSHCPMPGMSGEELLRVCAHVAPGVPVILVADDHRMDLDSQGDLSSAFAVIRGAPTAESLAPLLMQVMTLRPKQHPDSLYVV